MSSGSKVLMIDDAKTAHAKVRSCLARSGIPLYSAFTAEQGLAMARSIHPDVILLDIEMPSISGFVVCQQLKDDASLSNIPVIFLTAATSSEQKIRGLDLGAIDYITKPFDAAELEARVRVGLRNKELLDLLSKKAMIDGLTGLWNRAYLNSRLIEEIAYVGRHGHTLSCIMLDIDHFKLINDAHGHGFGDLVLRHVSSIVQSLCRPDDVACRYGGEEFVVLARNTKALSAMALADRMRKAIAAAPYIRGPISQSLTCSMGVADSSTGIETLLDQADDALYVSKQKGRNRVTLASRSPRHPLSTPDTAVPGIRSPKQDAA